jgi:hypothetical protein
MIRILLLVTLGFLMAQSKAYGQSNRVLNAYTSDLLQQSIELAEKAWDAQTMLLRRPLGSDAGHAQIYMVRESSWYALGLLERDAPGDRQRAVGIIDAVLKQQYTTPGVRWYGTFRRSPEEPMPSTSAKMWSGYDPNWREFIGTTFAVILIEFPGRVPNQLAQRMETAIECAIQGEIDEKRLRPTYSNIALMYGFLWDYAAVHGHRAPWRQAADQWCEQVYRRYKQYGAFDEYNSPTYYGVDLYGLALWRSYGSTQSMHTKGQEMEAGLWRSIATFYSPALRNLSGPFDRTYGMDMQSYVSLLGVWLSTVQAPGQAPLPAIALDTDHVADFWFIPHIAILGARIPDDAMRKLEQLSGEHLQRSQITEKRTATAWIGKDLIYGGEITQKTKATEPENQFSPATIQWRTPSGKIGWMRVVESPAIDAVADKEGLSIAANGALRIRLFAAGLRAEDIRASSWELPGLRVKVKCDAKSFKTEPAGAALDLVYEGMTAMRLKIEKVAISANASPQVAVITQ